MFLTYVVLLVWCICIVEIHSKINGEGVHDDVHAAQLEVEQNRDSALSIAIRFNTTTVIVSMCKNSNSIGNKPYESHILCLDKALVSIVSSNGPDFRIVRKGFIEYDSDHRIKNGLSSSANLLALFIADETQSSLQLSAKPLKHNSLIVSTDEIFDDASGLDTIFKVDVSGNFFTYRAVSIGHLSTRINKWLETRGVYLASQILRNEHNCSTVSNCTYLQGVLNSTCINDVGVQSCLSLLWDCLSENIGINNLSNYTIELATVQQQKRENYFTKMISNDGYFIKPTRVPSEVFRSINMSEVNNQSISNSSPYFDNNHRDSSRLFRWWRSIKNQRISSTKNKVVWKSLNHWKRH